MDWSNECVLEFIELLQREPCIWNPKSKQHKNRILVSDAWERIKNNFSIPCSIEDLKKKRNSLTTQYRECLKKIKDSTKTGAGSHEIYKPSWFAFESIHSFMGPVYDYHPTMCTESRGSTEDGSLLNETISEQSNNSPLSYELNNDRPLSRDSNSQSGSESSRMSKRQRGMQDLLAAKKQMDEAFTMIKNRSNQVDRELNECDLYGQLLSQKLKTMDEDDRLILMNEIDNLVFKHIFNAKKRGRNNTSHLSNLGKSQYNQPVHFDSSRLLMQPQVASQTNMPSSQTILNYEVPLKASTPFGVQSPQKNSQSNYDAIQISLPETTFPDSVIQDSVINNNLYTSNSFDPNVPGTSANSYKKPKVTNDNIQILSQTIIPPPRKRNIIQEAYNCSDDD